MSKILGTITDEGFTCTIHEDDDGRVHFVADADIDADGANGQNGQKARIWWMTQAASSLPTAE
jgi:flavin-dependent dehydrogenase